MGGVSSAPGALHTSLYLILRTILSYNPILQMQKLCILSHITTDFADNFLLNRAFNGVI